MSNQERLKVPIYIIFDNSEVRAYSSRKYTHLLKDLMDRPPTVGPQFYCHFCPPPEPTFDNEQEWQDHQQKHT